MPIYKGAPWHDGSCICHESIKIGHDRSGCLQKSKLGN